MLIEFKVTNFRSFRETQILSLVASTLSDHAETNVFSSGLKGFGSFVRTAAIYGPNAAGKTNLLKALQFMQQLVLSSATVVPPSKQRYDPHKFSSKTRNAPSEFIVTFAERGIRYEYGFAVTASRVESEWLIEYINPRGRMMFQRNFNCKTNAYDWKFSSFLKGQRALWSEVTRPDALFLSTAIQLNSAQLKPVFNWFQTRLIVLVGVVTMNPMLTINLLETDEGKGRVIPFLQEADLGIADLNIQRETVPAGGFVMGGSPDLMVHQRPGQTTPDLVKVTMSHWNDEKKELVNLDFEDESSGTRVLFRAVGAWLNVFQNGEVLLFDEIDTSLHPLLVKFLISRFHSTKTNPNNAQLVFTSHDTTLLSQKVLRRDQVWLVEKNNQGSSNLYPLTNFKPRNDEAIEKGYLQGRYGALPVLPIGSK